jgi:hypothetical protein
MHELLSAGKALEDGDLLRYAAQLGLDVAAFDRDQASRMAEPDPGTSTTAWPQASAGYPTLFIDGVVHRGVDPSTLLAALAR